MQRTEVRQRNVLLLYHAVRVLKIAVRMLNRTTSALCDSCCGVHRDCVEQTGIDTNAQKAAAEYSYSKYIHYCCEKWSWKMDYCSLKRSRLIRNGEPIKNGVICAITSAWVEAVGQGVYCMKGDDEMDEAKTYDRLISESRFYSYSMKDSGD